MARASQTATSTTRANNMVANLLRDRIRSGRYQAGDWLPTERLLAEDLRVDRRVVRTAINDLIRDGLVHRRPHCRPIVGQVPTSATSGAEPAASSYSDLAALIMWPGGGVLEHATTSQQRIYWGINQALAEADRHAVFLRIAELGNEEETAAREAAQLRYAVERGFGGIIFYPYAYRSNQALVEDVSRKMPLVTIDRQIVGVKTDFVGVDNHRAIFEATLHLAAQGHRRIAYATKWEQILPVQERVQGYMDAVREAGLPEIVLTIPSGSDSWTVTDGIFRLPVGERPTAAVVFNDYAAVGLMERLQNLGLTVPEDVALIGFDDIIPALLNGVGLTTIAQPYEEIGKAAVDLLLRRMKNPSAPITTVELPTRLVVRQSTAAPIA